MGFLIVVSLFLSYEVVFDHMIDRVKPTSGREYMLIHVFLIFGMNNLTKALDFMRKEEISLLPKIIFLITAFLLFFFCLYALLKYAKPQMRLCRELVFPAAVAAILFTVLMFLFREQMYVNIAISAVFAFAMFLRLFFFSREKEGKGSIPKIRRKE